MVVSEAEAKKAILDLVGDAIIESESHLMVVVDAMKASVVPQTDWSRVHRSAEMRLGSWRQILAYAQKKL